MNNPTLKNILLVEDELDIQKIVEFTLKNVGGYNVKACSSGIEALNVLSEYIPDLILMDVMMPKMDGPTTFKEIRKIPGLSNIPIIFVTAKVQAVELENYKALGAADIIVKPFDPITLPDLVKNIWEKQHG